MSLTELLEEAEEEEEQGIRWKKRKLKRRLLEYRQHLLERYTLNSTKSLYRPIVAIYKYYEIEILELLPINKKGVIIPELSHSRICLIRKSSERLLKSQHP